MQIILFKVVVGAFLLYDLLFVISVSFCLLSLYILYNKVYWGTLI